MDDWLDDDEKVRAAADAIRTGGGDTQAKLKALANTVYKKRKGYEYRKQFEQLRQLDKVDKALGRLDYLSELPAQPQTVEHEALEGKKGLRPPEQERVKSVGAALGAADPLPKLERQRPGYGTDIEGAKAALGEDAEEVIRGGKRAVADKTTTSLAAVRNEDPPIGKLWDELKKPEDLRQSGWMDLIGAVLDAPVKGAATAAARALAEATGDEARIAKSEGFFDDIGGAMSGNEKDRTLSAGGLQAAREHGWGDFFRYAAKRYRETGHEGNSVGDVVMWATGGDWKEGTKKDSGIPMHGAALAIMDRPISDLGDEDYEIAGVLTSLVADPLNFIPGKTIGRAGREGMYQATNVARKVAPKTTEAIGEKLLRHAGTVSEGRAYRMARRGGASPQEARQVAAELVDYAKQGSQGQELVRMQQESRRLQDMVGNLAKKEQDQLVDIIENQLRLSDEAGMVDMLRAADATKAGKRARRAVQAAKEFDDDALGVLRMTDEEIDALSTAAKQGDEAAAARLDKLTDAQVAFREGVGKDFWRVADELDLNPFKNIDDLVAAGNPKRVVDVARGISRLLGSVGEEAKELGVLGRQVDLGNYFPHVVDGLLGFNPTAPRSLTRSSELADVRKMAREAVENPEDWTGAADGIQKLAGFLEAPLKQQAKMLDEARDVLGTAPYNDDLAKFEELINNRFAGTVGAQKDIRSALGKYLEVMHPMMARARTGKRMAGLSAGGRPLIRSVASELAEAGGEAKGWVKQTPDGKWKLTKEAFTTDGKKYKYTDDVQSQLIRDDVVLIAHNSEAAKKIPALRGMVVDKAVAREVDLMLGKQSAEAMDYAFKMVGDANKYWVPLLLNTPGFHVRNWLYGVAQGYLYGGPGMFANVRRTRISHAAAAVAEHGTMTDEVVRLGRGEKVRIKDLAEELVEHGLVETGRIADLEKIASRSWSFRRGLGKIGQRLNPISDKGLTPSGEPVFKRAVNRPLARLQGYGGKAGMGTATIENQQRAQLYVHLRSKGMSPAQAAEQTVKAFFDYTGARLGRFGKRMRQLLPFYQWVRYSNVQIIDAMLTQPARFAHINRVFDALSSEASTGMGQGEDPGLMPQYAMERGAIPMPKPLGAMAKAVSERVLPVDPRNPGEVEAAKNRERGLIVERPGPNLLDVSSPGNALKQLSEQLGLAPSLLYELTTGKYLFGDQPLDPGFVQGLGDDGEAPDALERFTNMRYSQMPNYFAPKLGGPNASLLWNAMRRPTSAGRHSDVDQAEKQLWRTSSWMGLPKVVPYQPGQVSESQGARFDAWRKDIESAQRARLKTDPEFAAPSPMQTLAPGLIDALPPSVLQMLQYLPYDQLMLLLGGQPEEEQP